MERKAPHEVQMVTAALENAGFEAYIVGGCVRDMLLGRDPNDWDVTTNATPEQVQKVFPDSVYENDFGTVGIKTEADDDALKIVEVTAYRIEGRYTDKRHPDAIRFAKTLEEDLSRRDFTINACAARIVDGAVETIVDPFGGQDDLHAKIIRTVGRAEDRFGEDALRMLRAVRFAAQLGFDIDPQTQKALAHDAALLAHISQERIRDEFSKLIMTPQAAWGVQMLHSTELLRFIIPELIEGIGMMQNKHHIFSVWEHNLRALDYAVSKNYSFEIRLASLLHDVGKPRTKHGDGPDATFYAHEIVGGRMTKKILERLRYSHHVIEHVTHLVRYHLFYYNVGEVSEAGVRRFIVRVGSESIDDLIKVREADRIGSGVPKAVPYKLRHLLFMIEKVKRDPISPKALKINGSQLMELLGIGPSPRVGHMLNALLEEVIDNPARNTEEYLGKRAQELSALSNIELEALRAKAEAAKEEFEGAAETEMKRKHHV
ncbi:MAG: HD domain-containing protein [Candidatus Paceibacterota bacterium]|jgi:poly(A) polymerase/tRNA nucleotidyltransferase (CCA-adding enzyme)